MNTLENAIAHYMQQGKKRPLLVSLEGIDGSTKDTNADNLQTELAKLGISAIKFHLPNYGNPSCHFVSNFLNGKYKDIYLGPIGIATFFSVDRFESWNNILKPIYENNEADVIILNRWTFSNIFYQCARQPKDKIARGHDAVFDTIMKIEEELGIPKEDMLIYLDMPVDIADSLLGNREGKDINETDRDYQRQVYDTSKLIVDDLTNNPPSHINTYIHTVSCVNQDGKLKSKLTMRLEMHNIAKMLSIWVEEKSKI